MPHQEKSQYFNYNGPKLEQTYDYYVEGHDIQSQPTLMDTQNDDGDWLAREEASLEQHLPSNHVEGKALYPHSMVT